MASIPHIAPSAFLFLASKIIDKSSITYKETDLRRFRSLFGVSPRTCSEVWDQLSKDAPVGGRPIHLLWALFFLKVYCTEHVSSTITGADEKTFRKWAWTFVRCISNLKVIHWNSRGHVLSLENVRASVDGTDFRIQEPTPFGPKWYSHKFNGPGLWYEVSISISTGHIVWAHGPFPCGSFPDIRIFRAALKGFLGADENVVADGGYNDDRFRSWKGADDPNRDEFALIRARHETVNRRFKQFGVLGNRFRHSLHLHSYCFHAVCHLTQIGLRNGEPLFCV